MKKEFNKEKMQKFINNSDNLLNNEILIDYISNLNDYISNKRIIEIINFYVKDNKEKNDLIELVNNCKYDFILKNKYKVIKKQIKFDILNFSEFKYYDELVDNSNNNDDFDFEKFIENYNTNDDDYDDYDDYDTEFRVYYYAIIFSEELLKNSNEIRKLLINYIANRIFDFKEFLNFEYDENLSKDKIEKLAKKFIKDKSLLELLEIVNSNNSEGGAICL